MTGKPYKSKLAPFEQQIVELRRRRPAASYREIQLFLADQHGVQASINTIFTFLKIRRRWDRKRCGDDSQKNNSTAASASVQSSGSHWSTDRPETTRPVHDSTIQVTSSTRKLLHSQRAQPSRSAPAAGSLIPLLSTIQPRTTKLLKTFTPSSEDNLERLTAEEAAAFVDELKREKDGG